MTTTTTVGGKTWYTQTYTINEEDDAVSFVFSTGSGSPQTVDVADITTDKYFEISTSKDGDKYKVNDVTSTYATGIRQVIIENSECREVKVYTLDGRLIRSAQNGTDAINGLKKGVYIVNGKKVVVK